MRSQHMKKKLIAVRCGGAIAPRLRQDWPNMIVRCPASRPPIVRVPHAPHMHHASRPPCAQAFREKPEKYKSGDAWPTEAKRLYQEVLREAMGHRDILRDAKTDPDDQQ